VPKRLLHPSRRTIGLRVPDHEVTHALLDELGEPLLSSTLILPGDDQPLNDAEEIRDRLGREIDLVIDAGPCGIVPTTVVDLTGDAPVITRVGKGSTAPFGA
jgi:tRNA threonylcarbamoyl adenosine modification protein (Sua5/YciO/YrdC/YwlC family)